MMMLYSCFLTLHDNVFFASREMGLLFETEKFFHNWGLSYALFSGRELPQMYRLTGEAAQRPSYFHPTAENRLEVLSDLDIYVFPAQPLQWSYQINTFKAAQTTYYGKSKQFGDKGADRNYPINYGRAKELAVGSRFRTYILAPETVVIPRWIRLGKWAGKVQVEVEAIPPECQTIDRGDYCCDHPLNPLDLPPETRVRLYDRVVMPPASLLRRSQLSGEYLALRGDAWDLWRQERELPQKLNLPYGSRYGANYHAPTP